MSRVSFRVLRRFGLPDEQRALIGLANAATGWLAGRQNGNYEKVPLVGDLGPAIAPLITRSVAELGGPAAWDCYLLRYRPGSFVPPHKDPPLAAGLIHVRLNMVIAQEGAGGILCIAGSIVALSPGDAVVFRPDSAEHEVTRTTGLRLVWSVGTNLPEGTQF